MLYLKTLFKLKREEILVRRKEVIKRTELLLESITKNPTMDLKLVVVFPPSCVMDY